MLRYLRSAFSLPFQMHVYNWLLNWCFARSNSVYKYLYSDWVLYPLCIYIYIYKVQWVYNSELTAKKQIQTNQWEKLTKLRKLDKAVQCVKLQIQDHSNKVLVSKDFNRSTVLSMSSNVRALCSFQVNHIRHAKTIFQTFEDWIPNQFHWERLLSSASPTESQTRRRLHLSRYGQTCNGAMNDPRFPHHTDVGNTN